MFPNIELFLFIKIIVIKANDNQDVAKINGIESISKSG